MRPPREKPRRLTVEVPDELYAALTAAKIFSGLNLGELAREGLEHVADRYRIARRQQAGTRPVNEAE